MENRPNIISEKDFSKVIDGIVQELNAVKKTVMLPMSDNIRLYCEQYPTDGAKGNIVLVHGFTEFAEKYKEMIKYYRDLGLNVFIYDQRGHGLSDREVDDLRRIHVESFDRYVSDLEAVIDGLVRPLAPELPLYLFSHSMGGAVCALYMMKYPNAVKKAIMSAPMICPRTNGIPRFLVLHALKRWVKRDGWNAKFNYTSEFDPNVKFENALDGSLVRFNWALKFRLAEKRYQTSAATNRWMHEAITVDKRILRKELESIETDILILSAGLDTVVRNRYQHRFSKKLKSCRLVTVPQSKHNLFFSDEKVIKTFYTEIFSFLDIK